MHTRHEQVLQPSHTKVSVIVEGKPNQQCAQGMCFTKGKQKDNDSNEFQKHMQLHDLSLGKYLADQYALWIDFRMIDKTPYMGQIGGWKTHWKKSPYRLRRKLSQLGHSRRTSWMPS